MREKKNFWQKNLNQTFLKKINHFIGKKIKIFQKFILLAEKRNIEAYDFNQNYFCETKEILIIEYFENYVGYKSK